MPLILQFKPLNGIQPEPHICTFMAFNSFLCFVLLLICSSRREQEKEAKKNRTQIIVIYMRIFNL